MVNSVDNRCNRRTITKGKKIIFRKDGINAQGKHLRFQKVHLLNHENS